MVLNFEVLGSQEPNDLQNNHHKTKLPGVIKLVCKVFVNKFISHVFEDFNCLMGTSPLLFSQLCVSYHNQVSKHSWPVHLSTKLTSSLKTPKNFPQ